MDKDDIKQYLHQNLEISVGYDSQCEGEGVLEVSLVLEGVTIDCDWVTIEE